MADNLVHQGDNRTPVPFSGRFLHFFRQKILHIANPMIGKQGIQLFQHMFNIHIHASVYAYFRMSSIGCPIVHHTILS
jgi:hypothetical protein